MSHPRITYWKSRAAQGLNAHVVVFNGEEKFFAAKAEAQAHYDRIVKDEAAGGHVTSKAAANFATASTAYLDNLEDRIKRGVAAASQLTNHKKAVRALIDIRVDGDRLADILVSDLTAADIEFTILPGLAEGRASKTAHNYFASLRAILKFSVVKGWATNNPALNVCAKDVVGDVNNLEDKAEKIGGNLIAAIINASGDWSTAVAFATSTGLRQGEQRALKWKHVDFDRGFVKVHTSAKGGGSIGKTKTKAGYREVPLQDATIAQLRELRLASKFAGDDDYVFTVDGGLLSESRLLKVLKRACKRAEVPEIRWHDLRHYFASKLLENLQDELWTVSRLLGHRSIDTTSRIYAHWLQSDERDRKLKGRFAAINF
jgi:integrase